MKVRSRLMLLILTVILSMVLVSFITNFRNNDTYTSLPLITITICGLESDGETDRMNTPHKDCHSPVTSYVDKLPPPEIMNGVGISHLVITTKSDSAQKYFDQGLSLIHAFWDFEAYRAFRYATQLDSTSAMAHWGVAMTLIGNKSRKEEFKKALSNARKFSKDATAHEQLYIKALVAKDSVGDEKGYEVFRAIMEKIIHQYPEDVEAQLILWLWGLDSGYEGNDGSGDPKKDALYAQFMLEKLLRLYPNHPGVHHYWIHQMENCCPRQAVVSAEILANLTPNSGHMVHMPGHIYYRIGLYKKARASFISSMKVDSAYMSSQKIDQIDNWNYPHNLHYLIATCTEEGKYNEAKFWHKRLEEIHPPFDSLKDRLKSHRSMEFMRKVVFGADLDIRFGFWDKVIDRCSKIPDNDSVFAEKKSNLIYKNILLEYAKGMQAIENKKYAQAQSSADALDALLWRAINQEKVSVWTGFEKKFNVQSLELRGNLLSAKGDYKKALEFLNKALEIEKELSYQEPPPYSRPVAESIALAHLRAGEFEKSRQVYENILSVRPNSGFALFGIARAHELAGSKAEALKYYQQFLDTWNEADGTLVQIKRANNYLKTNR
jgi:tetratricopeptide (TPR) repeat protein